MHASAIFIYWPQWWSLSGGHLHNKPRKFLFINMSGLNRKCQSSLQRFMTMMSAARVGLAFLERWAMCKGKGKRQCLSQSSRLFILLHQGLGFVPLLCFMHEIGTTGRIIVKKYQALSNCKNTAERFHNVTRLLRAMDFQICSTLF